MSDLLVADFSNARVGDRVKSLVFGGGVVTATYVKNIDVKWDCDVGIASHKVLAMTRIVVVTW